MREHFPDLLDHEKFPTLGLTTDEGVDFQASTIGKIRVEGGKEDYDFWIGRIGIALPPRDFISKSI